MARPQGLVPGGFPEELFLNLSEQDKEEFQCSICMMILKDPRKCPSSHRFCSSCIFTWSLSNNEGRNKCPVCRTPGHYKPDFKMESVLSQKYVKCIEEKCDWSGLLRRYRSHIHCHKKPTDCSSSNLVLPPLVDTSSTSHVTSSQGQDYARMDRQITHRRQRVENMMENFSDQLERRRRNIQVFHRERENMRLESLREVRDLGRRLNHVATDLFHLMNNMSRDSERYQGYIRDQPDFGILTLRTGDSIREAENALRGLSSQNSMPGGQSSPRGPHHVTIASRGANDPMPPILSRK